MMSPDIQTKFNEDTSFINEQLSSSYEKMINVKTEIIKNEISIYPNLKDEKVHSVGMGFVITENN